MIIQMNTLNRNENRLTMSGKHRPRKLSLGSENTYEDAYFMSAPNLLFRQNEEKNLQANLKPKESEPTEDRHAWVILFASFCFNTICGYHLMCFGMYYVTFTETFETTKAKAGFIGAICGATASFCSIFASVFIELYGVKSVAVAGTLMAFVGILSSAFATNVYTLYVTYGFITGCGSSLSILCTQVIIQQHFNKHRKLATSISMVGIPTGSLLSPLITNFFLNTYGWRGTIILHSGIFLHTLLLVLTYSPPRLKNKPPLFHRQNSVKFLKNLFNCSVLKDPIIMILFVLGMTLMRFNLVTIIDHTPSRAVFFGADLESAGYLMTVMWLASLCARICCSFLSAFGLLLPVVGFLCVILTEAVGALALPLCSSYTAVMVVMVVFGIAQGFMGPCLLLTIVKLFGVAQFGRARALSNVVAAMGSFTATPLTGWMFDVTQNYNIPFYFSGLMGVVGALSILLVIIIDKIRKHRAHIVISNDPHKDGEYEFVQSKRIRTITC